MQPHEGLGRSAVKEKHGNTCCKEGARSFRQLAVSST